ncbi:MAG: hypothetical protein K8T25_16425 [Planctomycetia bacterium]|nr:hypothetical protein [Planctomycetia bacterium]
MNKRFQFSLSALLLVVTLAAGVCAAGTYVYREIVLARAAAVRASTKVKLNQVVTMLGLYNDNAQHLPKSTVFNALGEPTSSWRFISLPYIEQQDMDHPENGPFYDQSWASPGNKLMRGWAIPFFCFDNVTPNTPTFGHTHVFAITGPGTAFDSRIRTDLKKLNSDPATGDTILVLEVRNSKTHWIQPGDFDIRTMPHTINDPAGEGISGTCPGCFCVGFADTEAWMLRNDTPFDKLALFFTTDSARKHDREVELGPYRVK